MFDNHNAYRAPGAADVEDLKRRPNKAEHFASVYSHMHTGITAHPVFITADNLELLGNCTFVFIPRPMPTTSPRSSRGSASEESPRLKSAWASKTRVDVSPGSWRW